MKGVGFKVFEKGSAPVQTVQSVTVQKHGLISLHAAAHQMLDEAEAVTLMWDAERRLIGLKPCDTSDPNGYPARPTGGSTVSTDSNGAQKRASKGRSVLVAGTMFTQYIGLDTSAAHRWTPKLEGDVLVVDLKEEGQRVVSNRNKAKEAAAREEAAT
ncbi:MAG: hypothetical protein WA892_08165 [Ornithinimicrobium sp.]